MSKIPWQKIEGLLARSQSSNKEEARTSSHLLCQLIHKHKLKIVEDRPITKKVAKKRQRKKTTGFDFVDDFWDGVWQDIRPSSKKKYAHVIFIDARFSSRCHGCKGRINLGQRIAWYPDDGAVFCMECSKEAARA